MPFYDFLCQGCQNTEERLCSMAARHDQVCPCCGQKMTVLIAKPQRPEVEQEVVSEQLCLTFPNRRAYEAYLKANGLSEVSTSDTYWRNLKDKHRNRMDETARKLGYRDQDERQVKRKAARNRARG